MKKLLLLLCALLTGVSGAWAESKISKAVAGTYLFDSNNPALTVNKDGATITSDNGAIIIHHDNLSTVSGSRTYAAVVMKVDMPATAPGSFKQFINLKTSSNNGASIGLGVTADGKLKGTWQAGEYGPETNSAITGEHTIVLLCNNDGTTIYVDDASTSVNSGGLKCATKWTDLRIESEYASYVKSVYVFSGEQKDNISAFFSELSNVVTVANSETKSVSDNSTATRFFVASGGTLTANAAYDMDKIEGAGDVTVDANLTISGNIATIATGKLTIKEGKTLTLGTGDSQTNSIESFSSIDLCGTIYHNNKKATLNNVTVPSDKTGKIFAFDMGAETDAFKLAGTTTLTGNLTILSRWNAQIKVDELSGDGTWKICGTTGNDFDDTKTESSEDAIINIASASGFTGSAILNNYYATVNLTGFCHVSSLSGLAILNVAEGATISAPSVPNAMELHGAGDVVLTTFPTSTAPNLSSWTGTIEFPDKDNATNITEILNAWGNENSTIKLNNLTGYFSNNTTPVNPTLNILENKTLNINNGFSAMPPILSKLTGKGDLNISWGNCSNAFNLTIQKLFDFDGTLKTAKAPINVTKLVLDTDPAVDDLLIKTSGTVTLEKLYIGLEETTAYSWEAKTVEDVEGIYVSALDQVQQNRERAVAAIAPYFTYIGSGVGKYTVTLGSTPYTNTSDLEAAILGWETIEDCADPIIAINQPTSAFYRIKSGSKYLQDVRKGDDATQRTLTDAEGSGALAETIFYLDNNKLIGYKTGYGFGYSVCQTRDTEHLNTQLFTESAEMGKYTIQSQQGTCASAAYNEGYWGIDDSDLSRVADAASGACWTIETVTSLPVTISAAGYATLYSPVALTIPGGVTAYVATDMGDYLHLEAIGDDIIPAATGVILKGAAGTYDFAITTGGTAVSELTGTIATIAKPADAYYLSNGASGIGFYKSGTATTIPGFRAYLLASEGNVKSFRFDIPTAIEQIENEQQNEGSSTIYNLAGQRVNKAQKGIYIVNGKKVAVK